MAPAASPAVGPAICMPNAVATPTVATAASAGNSRAVVSPTPQARYAPAVVQYTSGGFWRYAIPSRRGTTQSPLALISRAISA